jgi:hypothetical protein
MAEGETALQNALQTTLATWDDPEVHPSCITYGLSIFREPLVREVPHPSLRALRGVPWLAGARCGIRKSVAQSGARPSTKAKEQPALTDR